MEHSAEFLDAVRRADTSKVAHLLDSHPDLARFAGEHGKTGLHWAAETDQSGVARLLIDPGAEIEAKTSWGTTPLDWAATMGSARAAEVLISRGASGLTLVVAAGLGKIDQVRATIESGTDLSGHRSATMPPINWVSWRGGGRSGQSESTSMAAPGATAEKSGGGS